MSSNSQKLLVAALFIGVFTSQANAVGPVVFHVAYSPQVEGWATDFNYGFFHIPESPGIQEAQCLLFDDPLTIYGIGFHGKYNKRVDGQPYYNFDEITFEPILTEPWPASPDDPGPDGEEPLTEGIPYTDLVPPLTPVDFVDNFSIRIFKGPIGAAPGVTPEVSFDNINPANVVRMPYPDDPETEIDERFDVVGDRVYFYQVTLPATVNLDPSFTYHLSLVNDTPIGSWNWASSFPLDDPTNVAPAIQQGPAYGRWYDEDEWQGPFGDQHSFDFYGQGIEGDFDGDGFVGIEDLNLLLENWGTPTGDLPNTWIGNIPSGAFVGIDELNALLNNWGASVP